MNTKKDFVPYAEQIKSPKWQKKRLEILNLHGFKCEDCGSETKTLNVHHRFYLKGRKIYEYDNDVFQVLCEECHSKIHEKKESEKTFPKNYIKLPDEYPDWCVEEFVKSTNNLIRLFKNEFHQKLADMDDLFYKKLFSFLKELEEKRILYENIDFLFKKINKLENK